MIQISGSAQRSFVFPANLKKAFSYFAVINRTISFLPHISIVKEFTAGRYRLLYRYLESGLYPVMIYCDVLAAVDREKHTIRFSPFTGYAPLKSKAGLYSMACQGYYNSETIFTVFGEQTRVEYSIQVDASLPVAFTLRFIPSAIINNIAQNKLRRHIEEITNSFIDRSTLAYTH